MLMDVKKKTRKHEYDRFCSFENNAGQGVFPMEKSLYL